MTGLVETIARSLVDSPDEVQVRELPGKDPGVTVVELKVAASDMGKIIASIIDFMNHDAPMSDLNTPTEKIRKILDRYNNREEFTF